MSFMLGAFANGLFSGMRSMDAIQSEWESLKQQRMADETGDIALNNSTKKQDTTLPPVTDLGGAGEWATREAQAPQWSDAERDKMPVPAYLRDASRAIYNPGERDRERQAYDMPAETPSSPREGKPYGAPPDTSSPSGEWSPRPPSELDAFNPTVPPQFGLDRAIARGAKGLAKAIGRGAPAIPAEGYAAAFGGSQDGVDGAIAAGARALGRGVSSLGSDVLSGAAASNPAAAASQPVVQPRTTAPVYLPPQAAPQQPAPAAQQQPNAALPWFYYPIPGAGF